MSSPRATSGSVWLRGVCCDQQVDQPGCVVNRNPCPRTVVPVDRLRCSLPTRMRYDAEITRHLFEHARDIVLVIDAESGAILDANRAAELAYGWSRDELAAFTIFDLRESAPSSVADQMRRADAS